MTDTPKKKTSRTIKLDEKVNDDLVRLCEARGVTVNSWLLNVVGDAVYKALAQERLEQATLKSTEAMLGTMAQMFTEINKEEDK